MRERLKDLAIVSEIVSGIAILITLIFLVVSIRDEAGATRTLVYEELLSGINDFYNEIMKDDQLASLWLTRGDLIGSDLSEVELHKLTLMYRTVMRILDAAHSASQYGTIGESEAIRMLDSACNTVSTLERLNAGLESDILVPISPAFREYLAGSCS